MEGERQKINWPMQHYVSAIFRNQRIDLGICGKDQFISGTNQVQVNVEAVSESIKKDLSSTFFIT